MPTCPPCDDKPATNALTSIHIFNDFNLNGSDIKGLHVKVKKSARVWGKTALSEWAVLPRHAVRIWYVNAITL